jgi:hypothetical protein
MIRTTPAERESDCVSNYTTDGQVYLDGGAACTAQSVRVPPMCWRVQCMRHQYFEI